MKDRGVTRQLRPHNTHSRLSRGTRGRATALAVSGGETQHSSLPRARAVPRWPWLAHARRELTAPARGFSPSMQDHGVTCQRRAPTHSRLSCGTPGRAAALAVSGDEAQHSKLLCARTVPRWLWSAYAPRNDTALARGLSHSVKDRGATCYLRPPKHSRLSRSICRHCFGCLCGGGATRKRAAFSRRAALVVVGPCPLGGSCSGERPLSFSARLLFGVPAAVSKPQPAIALHVRAFHCGRYLSGGGAAHKLSERTLHAALGVVCPCATKDRCATDRPLSLGARPWFDVPAAASKPQPAVAWCAQVRDHVRCLTGGGAARKLTERTRHAALAVVNSRPTKSRCAADGPLSFGAGPWLDVLTAASKPQPAVTWGARACHCVRCVSGGGAARGLAERARHDVLVMVALRPLEGHGTSERPFSFGARPWCDVPAAASNARPAVALHARVGNCFRCLSGRGAALELAARARRAALAVVGTRPTRAHCTDERFLPFRARPWCDVPATASKPQPAVAWHARAFHCVRYLSGGLRARRRRQADDQLAHKGLEGVGGHHQLKRTCELHSMNLHSE